MKQLTDDKKHIKRKKFRLDNIQYYNLIEATKIFESQMRAQKKRYEAAEGEKKELYRKKMDSIAENYLRITDKAF